MPTHRNAVILLLHGSRDPSWKAPFDELLNNAAAQSGDTRLASACLQFGSPSLEETVQQLFKEGIRKFTVIPIFISTRGHVAKDVPILVDKVRSVCPGAEIEVSPAIGEFPAVQKAMIDGIVAIGRKGS